MRLLTGLALFLLLTMPCLAQSDQTPSPSTNPEAAAQPANTTSTPPKRVWTNEDLHARNGVSVVGDKRNQNYHMTPDKPADPATVARIRNRLEKLNTQLEDTNRKLAGLKKFEQGDEVNDPGRQINKGLNRTPVDQQIAQLEDSKKKIEAQIGDLLDEARKKGIEPGQLR